MKPSIEHLSPSESFQSGYGYTHQIILKHDRDHLGSSELLFFSDPFPFYYLFYLHISPQFQGQGFGSLLLEATNQLLTNKKKPALLRNIIDHKHPARHMYQNSGWIQFDNDWLIAPQKNHLWSDSCFSRARYRIELVEKERCFYQSYDD